MLKNYLKIALRRFRRGGTHAFVNVFGLAVGMATCSLIFLLVYHEWSYDRFHEEAASIHRVYLEYSSPEGEVAYQMMMTPEFTPSFASSFSGVEQATRLVTGARDFDFEQDTFRLRMAEIDADFFRMFSFDVLAGDAVRAIEDPRSMAITSETAATLFGVTEANWSAALGRVITTSTETETHAFTVGAVIADFPNNSSLSFDLAASFENYGTIQLGGNNFRGRTSTYVRLADGTTGADIEAAAPPFTRTEFAAYIQGMQEFGGMAEGDGAFALRMQPLAEVHTHPDIWVPYEVTPHNPLYSYILLGIGSLILLIACINFMTLSVGQSTIRAREVGVRKVLGADRKQIMRQHWGESVVMATVALLLGFGMALLLLPALNNLAGTELSLAIVSPVLVLAAFVVLVAIVGVVAGAYPALVLSRFLPARVLKGSVKSPRNGLLTRSLVVVQFTISIGLIVSTGIMSDQLSFMLDKDLGFNDELVVAVNSRQVRRAEADDVRARMRDALLPYEQITNVERSGSTFTRGSDRNTWQDANGNSMSAYNFGVGYDYLQLMGMEMAEGRFFDEERPGDPTHSIVINEALVREYGIENPIGHVMTNWLDWIYEESPTVIGVVKDFYFQSLHNDVRPAVMNMHPDYYNYMGVLLVRIRPENVDESLALIEAAWNTALPGKPFTYSFIDQDLAGEYETEQQWQGIVTWSSLLAILIACMGLFGLAILAVGRRTKEIGIRKVMGASVGGVTALVSREFIVMVLVASVVATPIAYLAMSSWLEGFAFQVPISPWIFLGASVLTLTIALGTVGIHSIRAARSNPVTALRHE
jgi:putative ABC transport system permease protein